MTGSVSGIKAGRAFVVIEAIDSTQKVLDRINRKVRSFSNEMYFLGRSLAFGTVAMMVPLGMALRGFTRFDDVMRRVQARSTGTAEEFIQIRRQARLMAIETGYAAERIGELMNTLAQAGYSRKQIGVMTRPILDFAIAAGDNPEKDAQTSADIVTSVLKAFEFEAERTRYVADLLTAAANASKFSLEDIGTSLAYALRPAKDFNLTLEDTLAMVSQMRDLGIDPSTVGSATRNIMLEFSDSERWKKFNAQLSLATGKMIDFKDAGGNLRSPPELLFAVGEVLKELGTAEQSAMLQILLGKRAYTPGLAIARGKNPFRNFQSIFQNADGTSARQAETIMAGPGGALRRLLASIYDNAIAVGDVMENAIVGLSRKGMELTSRITSWIENNHRLVISLGLVTAAIVAGGIAMLAIAVPLQLATYLFSTFLTVTSLLFSPIRLITSLFLSLLGGIVSLGAALIAFKTLWTVVGVGFLMGATKLGRSFYSEVWQVLVGFGDWMSGKFKQIWEAASITIQTFLSRFRVIASELSTLVDFIINAFVAGDINSAISLGMDGLSLIWDQTLAALSESWQVFADGLREPFYSAIRDIWKFLNDVMQRYRDAVIQMQFQIKPLTSWGALLDPSASTYEQERDIALRTSKIERATADAAADAFYRDNLLSSKDKADNAFKSDMDQYAAGQRWAAIEARIQAAQQEWGIGREAAFAKLNNPAAAPLPNGMGSSPYIVSGTTQSAHVVDFYQQGTIEALKRNAELIQKQLENGSVESDMLTQLKGINSGIGQLIRNTSDEGE